MSEADYSLVVFGEDWGSHPSSTQHLIRRLVTDHPVLWIQSIGLRRPRITRHDVGRIWRKLHARNRPQNRAESAIDSTPALTTLAPRILPLPGVRWAEIINRRTFAPKIVAAAQAAGLTNPVLWISLPSAVQFLPALPDWPLVYYCGDDFAALDGVDHAPIAAYETILAEHADLIFTASAHLYAKFDSKKAHIIPHGADIARFQTPTKPAPDLIQDRPVVGFYGSLSAWLDMDMIVTAATALPEVAFVFVGPAKTDLSALSGRPNVHLLGERPHSALPGYSQHWQVSWLPFLDTPQIRACNPLKLREYLAAGQPVVSTDFPALDGYRDLVHVVSDRENLLGTLRRIIAEGDTLKAERQARVAGETWEARSTDVDRRIADMLACR